MAGEKPSTGTYETFDSGGGPTIPEGEAGNFANRDSAGGLDTSNAADSETGSVPEVPSTKR